MKILIAGGGVGGLAAAVGLCRRGNDVTVLERDPAPPDRGAAVTLFSNGFAALDGLGVQLPEIGGPIESMTFCTDSGSTISRLDLGVMLRSTTYPVRTVPRRQLITELARLLPAGTLQRGVCLTDVTVSDGTVTAHDSVGRQHRPDLLIGADGHRSVVRRDMVDPAPAREVGWSTWQGLGPVLPAVARGRIGWCVVGQAGLVGLMPAGEDLVQWWFDVRTAELASFAAVREAFRDYGPMVAELLSTVDDASATCFTHVVHDVPDAWGSGPTTLVGDAAHAFPPSQAQGANQALEDACVLVRALGDHEDPVAAARWYERTRCAPVRRISALAASEVTNRPVPAALRLAGRLTPPSVAGRVWLRTLRRSSTVLGAGRTDRAG